MVYRNYPHKEESDKTNDLLKILIILVITVGVIITIAYFGIQAYNVTTIDYVLNNGDLLVLTCDTTCSYEIYEAGSWTR